MHSKAGFANRLNLPHLLESSEPYGTMEKKSWSVTIQIKATELYFPVVLFVMLYKVKHSKFSVCVSKQSFPTGVVNY